MPCPSEPVQLPPTTTSSPPSNSVSTNSSPKSVSTVSCESAQRKASLRRVFRHQRRSLSASVRDYSARLLAMQSTAFTPLRQADRIAFYMASDGEIDPMALLIASWGAGKRCYLPVIQANRTLLFARYESGSALCVGQFGILVPETPKEMVTAHELDAICLPLVAFDRQKQRLGMGGGFYDRTLSGEGALKSSVQRIGLAFDCQLSASLPVEPWDQALQAVITPSRVWS